MITTGAVVETLITLRDSCRYDDWNTKDILATVCNAIEDLPHTTDFKEIDKAIKEAFKND